MCFICPMIVCRAKEIVRPSDRIFTSQTKVGATCVRPLHRISVVFPTELPQILGAAMIATGERRSPLPVLSRE